MPQQHVYEVLSLQWELREAAQRLTEDVNEGRLLVHKVVSHALNTPNQDARAMRRELVALAEEAKRAHQN